MAKGKMTKDQIRVTKGFENLRVYQLAEKLADSIWVVAREWDQLTKDTIGRQLICAAGSIGTNIAEGTGRRSFQANRRFVRIARGSLYETKHWLRRAHSRQLLSVEAVGIVKPILDELGPKLNAYFVRSDRCRIFRMRTAQPHELMQRKSNN